MHTTSPIPGIQCRNSAEIPEPAGHYSHVCIAGGFIHISGLLPIDTAGKPMFDTPFKTQLEQTLENLDACLKCADVTRDSLVQVRIYLTDMDAWPQFNAIYSTWMGAHRPARAVAGVASLHFRCSIEVEALALTSGS